MGEIAEMMLNGSLCEGCGELMPDHREPGYPRRCSGCQPAAGPAATKPGRSAKRRAQRRRAALRSACKQTQERAR